MDKIDRLLSQIISLWRASDCNQAKDAVSLLQKVSNKRERPRSGLPPRIDLSKAKPTTGAEELFELLRCTKDNLTWLSPSELPNFKPCSGLTTIHNSVKYGILVGKEEHRAPFSSDNIILGFAYLPAGVKYPLHAQDSEEVVQILSGHSSWGPALNYLRIKEPGEFVYNAAAVPHAIHVDHQQPLLTVFAWSGNLAGKFWFLDTESGDRFGGIIRMVKQPNSKELYNKMAENYEEIVRGWGYNMPEVVAGKIRELSKNPEVLKVLDLGCGDGLVGESLKVHGFTTIVGMDISAKMLEIAAAKDIYLALSEVDLMQKLPAATGAYDVMSCVGTTTYLDPTVFEEWLRVVKPGGILVFTHKTGVLAKWEAEQDRREQLGQWKKVYRSNPLYYLPTLTGPDQERVHVYVYKKL